MKDYLPRLLGNSWKILTIFLLLTTFIIFNNRTSEMMVAVNANLNKQTNLELINYEPEYEVVETFNGTMTGYGYDCKGCSGNLACNGQNVKNNIYYNDSYFGTVRIAAADRKYPCGTIIRINNADIGNKPILAIVLDRGGGVGFNKQTQLDLLYVSESEANSIVGLDHNIKFEILRIGF